MLLQTLSALLLASCVSGFILPFKLATVTEAPQVASEYNGLSSGYWYTNITVGTPAQVFTVVIDTFSGSTWVAAMGCSATGCYNKTVFDSTKSSTFSDTHVAFTKTDHFGLVLGEVGQDRIQLGNDDGKVNVVAGAKFGVATTIPSTIGSIPNVQGVLGLAFSSLAATGTEPVLITANNQGALTAGVFSVWLEDQYETSDNGTNGVIYYGNYDALHCNVSQKSSHPLSKAQYYQVTVHSFKLDGNNIYPRATQAIVDTTSLYISAPPVVVDSVLGSLGLQPDTQLPAIVPCHTKLHLAFHFHNDVVHVNQLNMILKQQDGTCKLALLKSVSKNFDNGWRFELGVPFLRGRCTFFDFAGHTIGFSDAKTHAGH